MIELAAATLRAFGALRLRVTGSSMLPAILPGDVVSIRACGGADAAPGEVVLFRRDERFFVHRVVQRCGDALVTCGDALQAPDPPVHARELLGKVVGIERRGRPVRLRRAGLVGQVLRRSALATRLYARWAARPR